MLEQRQYVEEVVQLGLVVRAIYPGGHVLVRFGALDLVHGAYVDGRERERVERQVRVLDRGHRRRRVELEPHDVHQDTGAHETGQHDDQPRAPARNPITTHTRNNARILYIRIYPHVLHPVRNRFVSSAQHCDQQ